MTKSCVGVTVRIKPLEKGTDSCGLRELNATTLQIPKQIQNKVSDDNREFKVDSILGEKATQEECFQSVTAPLIHSLLDGYNGTVLAYGQTGAGKSHTMFGPDEDDYVNRGMCSRAISSVFDLVRQRGLKDRVTISLSAIECYNETLVDMFVETDFDQPKWDGGYKAKEEPTSRRNRHQVKGSEESDVSGKGGDLWLHEDADGVTQVKNLSVIEAINEEDALTLLYTAASTRTISSHAMNARSSRAHFILTIHVAIKPEEDEEEKKFRDDECYNDERMSTVAKLHMVDLAGSERVERTNSVGLVMREAGFINKSLSFLEQVVMALADGAIGNSVQHTKGGQTSHIPYRRSKLTHLLKDSIGGNCRTALVSCICIEKTQLDQTLQTLKFSERMRCVENDAIINKLKKQRDDNIDTIEMLKMKRQIETLKQELIMHDVVSGLVKYRDSKIILLKKNIINQNLVESSTSSSTLEGRPMSDELLLQNHGMFGMSEFETVRFKEAIGKWVLSPSNQGGSGSGSTMSSGLPLMPSWQLVEAALHLIKEVATVGCNNSSVLQKAVTEVTGYDVSSVKDASATPWPTMKRSIPTNSSSPFKTPKRPIREESEPTLSQSSVGASTPITTPSTPTQRPLSSNRLHRVGSGINITEKTPKKSPSNHQILKELSPRAKEGEKTDKEEKVGNKEQQVRREWEMGEGQVHVESFRKLNSREKELKKRGKTCASNVNNIKVEIDRLSNQLALIKTGTDTTLPQPAMCQSVHPPESPISHLSLKTMTISTQTPENNGINQLLNDQEKEEQFLLETVPCSSQPVVTQEEAPMMNATLSTSAKMKEMEPSYDSDIESTQSSPAISRPCTANKHDRFHQISNPSTLDNNELQHQLRIAKRHYREAYSALQSVKEELKMIQREKGTQQHAMVKAFETWYKSNIDVT